MSLHRKNQKHKFLDGYTLWCVDIALPPRQRPIHRFTMRQARAYLKKRLPFRAALCFRNFYLLKNKGTEDPPKPSV